jgi:serine/threonine-protein kinase
MPITVVCAGCGTRFDVPDHYAGRTGNCTSCGAPMRVPGEAVVGGSSFGPRSPLAASGSGSHRVAPAPAPPRPHSSDEHPAAVSAGPLAGKQLGDTLLKRQLGGSKSGVYLADSPSGPVAVKVLPQEVAEQSETAGKRFLREARALFGMTHPNLVKCLNAGEELGTYFLVMEYFDGKTLAQVLAARGGRLPEDEAIRYASSMAKGLGFLASKSLVHRNLKPTHVLVNAQGDLKLVGMGLVRGDQNSTEVQVTGAGMIVGTPQYMSPEQAMGQTVDHRSDLYSLGCTLYELIAGSTPFNEKIPSRVVAKLVKEPAPPLQKRAPDASNAAAAILEKLLHKLPDDRYQTADELVTDLDAVLTGRLVAGLPPSFSGRAPGGGDAAAMKKLYVIIGVLAVVVLALIVVVALK